MSTAAIIGGSIAGGLATSAIGANAAGNAASTQADAAKYVSAATLQAQTANEALGVQGQEYNNAEQLAAPNVQGGQAAIANLESLLGIQPQGNEYSPAAPSIFRVSIHRIHSLQTLLSGAARGAVTQGTQGELTQRPKIPGALDRCSH